MTKIYRNAGRDTDNEKGMTYRKFEKERNANAGGRSALDPLGPNSEIGRKLRQYYDELVSEDIPDRFNALLGELERKEDSDSSTDED